MLGYKKMLLDLELSQSQMDVVVESLNVINVKTTKYYKDNSKIHGEGIFATNNMVIGSVIGLGSIDEVNKTFLGRYTNHSDNANAMFYYIANGDVVMIAEEYINKGEEILIDYRDHTLRKIHLQ
tara:strand:- start:171 stop:542 length:372 start_codon:yes stop_codon:yes gene_type:complete